MIQPPMPKSKADCAKDQAAKDFVRELDSDFKPPQRTVVKKAPPASTYADLDDLDEMD